MRLLMEFSLIVHQWSDWKKNQESFLPDKPESGFASLLQGSTVRNKIYIYYETETEFCDEKHLVQFSQNLYLILDARSTF